MFVILVGRVFVENCVLEFFGVIEKNEEVTGDITGGKLYDMKMEKYMK